MNVSEHEIELSEYKARPRWNKATYIIITCVCVCLNFKENVVQ